MEFQKINIWTGWAMGVIATIVYALTLEPTMPFWDCGEFISSVYKLEVGHPPGAPLFMLIGRVFSAFVEPATVPVMINFLSALCSGLTIVFLFWTITHFAKKFVDTDQINRPQLIAIVGSGVIGAMVYTFSDTFWFSAVEAEVYAMSSLFTAVVFWAILKWESSVGQPGEIRWIVLIAYLMGLSIGVHLLNLLAIPAICLVYYFKKFPFSVRGLIVTGAVSLVLLFMINSGVIIYFVQLAGTFERTFVNSMHMPFNSGAIFYFVMVAVLIIIGLIWSQRTGRVIWNTAILGITMAILGYTTFATVIIRSNANPPMDENNPENVFSLLSYLNREQYGDRPLLHGQYFNTPLDLRDQYKDGADVWVKSYSVREDGAKNTLLLSSRDRKTAEDYIAAHPEKKGKLVEEYVESGEKKGSVPNYDKKFCGLFPRMHSSQGNHIGQYKEWSNFKNWNSEEGRKRVQALEKSLDDEENKLYGSGGKDGSISKINSIRNQLIPSTGEEIKFFTSYQISHMYWRYFMWNFAGRQNDRQGNGEFSDGNWISGVTPIDECRIDNTEKLTSLEKWNPGKNGYFYLPLILGLIGLVFQLKRNFKDFTVVLLLFILTGVAIVIYLNQTPLQPRERDYAFAGSFYAFAIWIGLSVYALYHVSRTITTESIKNITVACVAAPGVLFLLEYFITDSFGFSGSLLFMGVLAMVMILIMLALRSQKAQTSAVAAFCIAIIAPIIMGMQNWDDHTRADRKTGLAMAINYLESLAPNAIIFTNGDNDTFPLWYAQEVEGIRTDVRVVNLSLLNTDWYIDQMKRQAYNSEPVPFTMTENQYRQGTRDVLFVDPKKETKRYLPVGEALATALDDSKKIDNGRSKVAYIPSSKMTIPVKPEDAEKFRSNLKPGDSLVTSIDFELADDNGNPRSYITKANLAVLDLLAHMDWNRPVYFAVTTGGEAYMGLEQYFQLEGLAYRLVPIRHQRGNNPNLEGSVNTSVMYENMMNKFQWGNMDSHPIYMDENNRRMTTNLRLQFGFLAEYLIAENKMDSAKQVLHKALQVMPEKTVPYEQTQVMQTYVELLLKAGDLEGAKTLAKRLFVLNNEELDYYHSLTTPNNRTEYNRTAKTAVQVNNRLAYYMTKYLKDDPDTKMMNDALGPQLQEFEMPTFEEILKQQEEYEKQMKEYERMMKTQDSIKALNKPKTNAVVESSNQANPQNKTNLTSPK